MFEKARDFLKSVEVEMKKVSWPEREELINSTMVVFIISALFTLFIYLADLLVSTIIEFLYS